MESKLFVALTALEKARTAALEAAIAEKSYRVCAVLDSTGQIQKGLDRAHRMLNGKDKPAKK